MYITEACYNIVQLQKLIEKDVFDDETFCTFIVDSSLVQEGWAVLNSCTRINLIDLLLSTLASLCK